MVVISAMDGPSMLIAWPSSLFVVVVVVVVSANAWINLMQCLNRTCNMLGASHQELLAAYALVS